MTPEKAPSVAADLPLIDPTMVGGSLPPDPDVSPRTSASQSRLSASSAPDRRPARGGAAYPLTVILQASPPRFMQVDSVSVTRSPYSFAIPLMIPLPT